MLLAAAENDLAATFIELGAVLIGLAILARVAAGWGIPSIALYLLGGLAFGNGGLAPLKFSESFVHLGAEVGVVLLLFMLGLEYTARQLWSKLRSGLPAGGVDLALNLRRAPPPGCSWDSARWEHCCWAARRMSLRPASLPKHLPICGAWTIPKRRWSSRSW